jgi:hypothetical protein
MRFVMWLAGLTVAASTQAAPQLTSAFVQGDSVYLVDSERLHRFGLDGRFLGHSPLLPGTFVPKAGEIEARAPDRIAVLDLSLRVKSRCELPLGWVFDGTRAGAHELVRHVLPNGTPNAYGLCDPRMCRLEPFSAELNALIGVDGVVAMSPDHRLVAVSTNADSGEATVYAYPSLERRRTEQSPGGSAHFGPDVLDAVAKNGALSWLQRGSPCFAMDPSEYTQVDTDVYATPAAIVAGRSGPPNCPLYPEQVQRELAHLCLQGSIALAKPGLVVVLNGPRAFRVTFAKRDYARPRIDEVTPPEHADAFTGVVESAGSVVMLEQRRGWLLRATTTRLVELRPRDSR